MPKALVQPGPFLRSALCELQPDDGNVCAPNSLFGQRVYRPERQEAQMGFGRGVLFWLLGIPLPIIILLALFWHH